MTDPDPSAAPPPKARGVMALFNLLRRSNAEPDTPVPEPATEATGQLVVQARAFQDLRVDDVMQPRADIVAVERSCPFSELVERFVEAEHSRIPVYRETLDDPVGVV
ncbi:MAG: magnesium/cobalt efflux protein, partial [Phenylobacterium sp.]